MGRSKRSCDQLVAISVLHRFWPTSQYTNRQEGNKKARERKTENFTYIIEGVIIQLNMKSGDISFDFLNEVLLM